MIEVEVNHSERLGAPRNQGRRPTCLVFTTSDLNAFANATAHLSVEFLCHHAAKAGESWEPGDGFTVDEVFTAVAYPGQPEENSYPYRPDSQDAPLQAPPSGLMPLYQSPSNTRALTLSEITSLIRQGRAVGIVIAITKSLFYPRDGIIDFDPYVIPEQFHAMVAVGVGTHRMTNETHIYLRNSWGTGWGNQGHAWVPERHLQLHMQEGFAV